MVFALKLHGFAINTSSIAVFLQGLCSGRNMTWWCPQRLDKLFVQKLSQAWCWEATGRSGKRCHWCNGCSVLLTTMYIKYFNWIWTRLLTTVVLCSAFQGSDVNQLQEKNSHFSYIDISAAIKIFPEVSEFISSQSLPFLPFLQSTAILPSFTGKPSGVQRSYCQIHLSMSGYGSPCSHMLGEKVAILK